jgi:hypothetical protein
MSGRSVDFAGLDTMDIREEYNRNEAAEIAER